MIATTKTPLPKHDPPAVADPRRSYDRGIWVGSIADDVTPGTSMPDRWFTHVWQSPLQTGHSRAW